MPLQEEASIRDELLAALEQVQQQKKKRRPERPEKKEQFSLRERIAIAAYAAPKMRSQPNRRRVTLVDKDGKPTETLTVVEVQGRLLAKHSIEFDLDHRDLIECVACTKLTPKRKSPTASRLCVPCQRFHLVCKDCGGPVSAYAPYHAHKRGELVVTCAACYKKKRAQRSPVGANPTCSVCRVSMKRNCVRNAHVAGRPYLCNSCSRTQGRAAILLTFNGETRNMAQWAAHIGVSKATLHYRLAHMSLEEALTKKSGGQGPQRKKKNNVDT